MARTVDKNEHDRQKAEIAGAVWRISARAGLESVSMREVAAEAGVSIGRVQHYFPSKDAMLLFGLRLAQERMEARIKDRLRELSGDVDEAEVLRAAVEEVVGGDPDTSQAIRVSVAYLPRAMVDSEVAAILFEDDEELHALAAGAVRVAQSEGRAAPDLDPELEARIIWSLANDLGSEVAFGQTEPSVARAAIEYHLARVLGA